MMFRVIKLGRFTSIMFMMIKLITLIIAIKYDNKLFYLIILNRLKRSIINHVLIEG